MNLEIERLFDAVPSTRLNHLPDLFEETHKYHSTLASDLFDTFTLPGPDITPNSPSWATDDGQLATPTEGGYTTSAGGVYDNNYARTGPLGVRITSQNATYGYTRHNTYMPVTPGNAYEMSCYARFASAHSSHYQALVVGIFWYNSSYGYISASQILSDGTTDSSQNSVWRFLPWNTTTAPAGAAYARVFFGGYSTAGYAGSIGIDDLLFRQAVEWTTINHSAGTTVEQSTSISHSGTTSLKITSGGAAAWRTYKRGVTGSTGIPVDPGMEYNIRAYMRAPVVTTRSARVMVQFWPSGPTAYSEWVPLNNTGTWFELSLEGLIPPSTASNMEVYFQMDASAAGEVVHLDSYTVEQRSSWIENSNIAMIDREDVRTVTGSTRSMKVQSAAAGDVNFATRPEAAYRFEVVPGINHLVSAWVDSDSTANVQIGMSWYDAEEALIGTDFIAPQATDAVANEWSFVAEYLEAPAAAVTATYHLRIVGATNGQVVYFDEPSVTPIMYAVPNDGSVEKIILKQVLLVNTSSSAVNVSLLVTPRFSGVENRYFFLKDVKIPANKTLPFNQSQVILPGEQIIVSCDVADAMAVHATAIVETP